MTMENLKYNKNERPKWTCNAVLRKRLNRSGNFWFQIESMNVLRVNYGLDFAFSPRGPCPRPFLLQENVQEKRKLATLSCLIVAPVLLLGRF